MTASGCGVMAKEYGHLLRNDARYAERARQISALTKDLSELLPDFSDTPQALATEARRARAATASGSPTIRPARYSTASRSAARWRRC
ncbi:hypothetical protein ACU4GD_35615 [Cupriavidus basilensis]